MKLLIINPGSTSTKMSVFEGRENLFTESVFHDAPLLLSFKSVNGQTGMRKGVIMDFLSRHGLPIGDIDVYVGRGGCAYSQSAGVMEIDKRLYEDTRDDKGGSDHAAKLGVMLAYELGTEHGKPMYTMNPTNTDELEDVARITGLKGVYRRAQSHVLNQKGIARLHSKKRGKEYEQSSYIVCHIDGGITVSAHKNGMMIDGNEGAGGDGPFSPTRLGSVPLKEIASFMETHEPGELAAMCSRSGGFVSHFGTSNSDKIHALVESGDEHATLVWKAMIYQIGKEIGAMAAVLGGKVDAILLTGGLLRFADITSGIEEMCSWIAPIYAYPGEVEQEELASGVMDVLEGKAEARTYTGKPVFSGYPWDKG